MNFTEMQSKGLARYLVDADLGGEPLHIHITEVGPGDRAHPPHRHGGIEGFYMLDGEGTLEIDGETYPLRSNEGVVFDPRKLHGLVNTSAAPMRYIVIITRESNNNGR